MKTNSINVLLLNGDDSRCKGFLPQQHRPGDRGFDCFIPWISDGTIDPQHPHQLKRLWDFFGKPDTSIVENIGVQQIEEEDRPVYILRPNQEVIVGLGINFDMRGWTARIVARSSTVGKRVRSVTNFPIPRSPAILIGDNIADFYVDVPIDSNFSGEPRTILKNFGNQNFLLYYGRKITQLVFDGPDGAQLPELIRVNDRKNFEATDRDYRSHASSGDHHNSIMERSAARIKKHELDQVV